MGGWAGDMMLLVCTSVTLQTIQIADVAVSSEYGNTALLSEKKYQRIALISISN